MDFVALDVETANADLASICAVGLVHFRGGQVYRSLELLIDPQDHFDPMNIAIHGITPDRVAGKPTMKEAIPAIGRHLANCVIVHHSPFDRTALHKAAERFGVETPDVVWLDSLRIARRAWLHHKETGGYGLANLCQTLSISFRHHEAAEDARAAGLIVLRAIAETGIPLEQWPERCDRPLHWTSGDEARPERHGNPAGALAGEIIAFTGRLRIARNKAADLAAAAGCDVGGGVTRHTTILVVGDQDIRLLAGHDKSSKHRKAEKLIGDGYPIRIIGESDFLLTIERHALRPALLAATSAHRADSP